MFTFGRLLIVNPYKACSQNIRMTKKYQRAAGNISINRKPYFSLTKKVCFFSFFGEVRGETNWTCDLRKVVCTCNIQTGWWKTNSFNLYNVLYRQYMFLLQKGFSSASNIKGIFVIRISEMLIFIIEYSLYYLREVNEVLIFLFCLL